MAFGLWEADTLIDESLGRRAPSPERRLLVAVLATAVAEFQEALVSGAKGNDSRRHKLEVWFQTRGSSWPCSFERLCELLDLDAERIRKRLATLASAPSVRPRCRPGRPAKVSAHAID